MSRLGELAVHFAVLEMRAGAREVGGNNAGPFVQKYLNAEHPEKLSHQGEPWCAAFFGWCWLRACAECGANMPVKFTRSSGTLQRSLAELSRFVRPADFEGKVYPGDAAFWDHDGDGSANHVNMVFDIREGGVLLTIGGNEGAAATGSPVKISRRGKVAELPQLLGFGLMCPGGEP